MRKIYSLIVASLLVALTGCNMDLRPYSTIDLDNAVTSVQDAAKLRNFIYANMRGATSGSWVFAGELQADFFNASSDFGNNYGDLYRWDFTTSQGDAESMWSSCYGVIANNNFMLEAIDNYIAETKDLSDEDKATLRLYKGEAYFQRAYMYFQLALRFCADYDPATAANEMGAPIVLKYAPTSDESTYPGRESLQALMDRVLEDLDSASVMITTPGSVGAKYFTEDVVKAFRARVALYMEDYATAKTYARQLVEGGKYPLVADAAAYDSLFRKDSGEECIMQVFASISELPSSSQYGYIGYSKNLGKELYAPSFIPTKKAIDKFNQNDMRFTKGFIKVTATLSSGASEVYLCNKFPGNPDFYKGDATSNNYCNSPKPFRIAEQYLILAEAYARMTPARADSAVYYIAKLRENRIEGWENDINQGSIIEEIKNERIVELFAEGFRLFDLKRYGEGMDREEAQDPLLIYLPGDSRTEKLNVLPENYRFVWPIPLAEITSNPQIRGQQNPGYSD